jgi:hypothetical protein
MAKNAMVMYPPGAERDALVRELSGMGWMVAVVDSPGAAHDALRWTHVALFVVEANLAGHHLDYLLEPLDDTTLKVVAVDLDPGVAAPPRVQAMGTVAVLGRPIDARKLAGLGL